MLAKYYQFLNKYISFKSISDDEDSYEDMKKLSQRIKSEFSKNKLQAKIVEWYGNPIVLWYYQTNKNAPTCLLYGHYDVQNVSKNDGWKHDPFSLYIWRDKVIWRGVSDNKGQTAIHLQTIFDLIKEDRLGYNLIVLLEGDYSHGSTSLAQFLDKYKDSLQADFALISSGELIDWYPCIDCGFRWWLTATLTLKTANKELHSGLYGGVVPNAIHEMNKLLSKLFDSGNHVMVPYFYYDVVDANLKEKAMADEKDKYFDLDKFKKDTWVKAMVKEREFSFYSQLGFRPTIQVTNIESWQGSKNGKNTIAHEVTAHINFRLVNNQNPEKIARAFEWWVESNIPQYVDYIFNAKDFFSPIKVNTDHHLIEKTKSILSEVYWKNVLHNYSWWWLPVVKLFRDILWLITISVPLANDDSNMHGTNENLDINLIQKWMEFSKKFFQA